MSARLISSFSSSSPSSSVRPGVNESGPLDPFEGRLCLRRGLFVPATQRPHKSKPRKLRKVLKIKMGILRLCTGASSL